MPEPMNETASVDTPPTLHVNDEYRLTQRIIACAIEVHRALGPGLLESAYVRCLAHEFSIVGLPFQTEIPVPIRYKGLEVQRAYRIDFLVADTVIVEAKSIERFAAGHSAQLLTYMKFMRTSLGLLINFNVTRLADGVRRYRR